MSKLKSNGNLGWNKKQKVAEGESTCRRAKRPRSSESDTILLKVAHEEKSQFVVLLYFSQDFGIT